jgi:hypothetical protein
LEGKGGEATFRMVVKIVLTEGRVESPPSREKTIGDKSVPERGKIGDAHDFAQTQNPCSLCGKKDVTKSER